MKDYKIIENRPELNAEEINQGMHFSKVKANSLLLKKAAMKIVWLKIAGFVFLSSAAIIIYSTLKNNDSSVSSSSQKVTPHQSESSIVVSDSIDNDRSDSIKIINKIQIEK